MNAEGIFYYISKENRTKVIKNVYTDAISIINIRKVSPFKWEQNIN